MNENALKVAVAGNPNSGKSTLINSIAGTRMQVGNWAGVTVEKKVVHLTHKGRKIELVDLPGTYSLSPYSEEEIIARNFLIHEKPDVIIDVVDATNLERNLYLTIQLMELGVPIIMALNIHDEALKKGYIIDTPAMTEMLGIQVIPTVSTKNTGLAELFDAVISVTRESSAFLPKTLTYSVDIENAVQNIAELLKQDYAHVVQKYNLRWLVYKLMENDRHVLAESKLPSSREIVDPFITHLKKAHDEDIESMLTEARYAQASGITREVLKEPEMERQEITATIDKIVLNKYLGIPIFLFAMWIVFKLTFDLSTPFVDWIDGVTTGPFKRWAETLFTAIAAPDWTISLITDGIIAGVGFVLVFVPVIFAMMFFITFLEASGYMARAAFIMDRAMHALGLHGKSFIPMLLGFGCNVPGVYATRTLESTRDRILTSLLLPLMSCGARLPVYVLFVGVFFVRSSGTVLWSLYVLGIALAVLMGIIFKHLLFKGKAPLFIMELPPYRLPSWKSLCIHTWEKGKHFLVKAGTYIFAVSIIVWFMLNLPWGVQNKKDSLLGMTGQVIAPVLKPLGFGTWEAASSLITGIVAKEIIVGSMGEIYAGELPKKEIRPTFIDDVKGIGTSFLEALQGATHNIISSFGITSLSTEVTESTSGLRSVIKTKFSPLSAYAFMVFVLIYMPCVVVAIALRQEFGSWKWFWLATGYELTLAWIMSFIVYQGGQLIGLGV